MASQPSQLQPALSIPSIHLLAILVATYLVNMFHNVVFGLAFDNGR